MQVLKKIKQEVKYLFPYYYFLVYMCLLFTYLIWGMHKNIERLQLFQKFKDWNLNSDHIGMKISSLTNDNIQMPTLTLL